MSKHKALDMFGRSGNPTLSDATFADFEKTHGRFVVCDFVCPTKATRKNFDADIVVWMDTIKESNYKDTDSIFEEPQNINLRISEWNQYNPKEVAKLIRNV